MKTVSFYPLSPTSNMLGRGLPISKIKFISRATRHGKASAQVRHWLGLPVQSSLSLTTLCMLELAAARNRSRGQVSGTDLTCLNLIRADFARSLARWPLPSTSALPVHLQGSPKSATFLFLDQSGWIYKYAFSHMYGLYDTLKVWVGLVHPPGRSSITTASLLSPSRPPLYTDSSLASLTHLDKNFIAGMSYIAIAINLEGVSKTGQLKVSWLGDPNKLNLVSQPVWARKRGFYFLPMAKPTGLVEVNVSFLSSYHHLVQKRSKQPKQTLYNMVIWAINFNSDLWFDLRGCLEASKLQNLLFFIVLWWKFLIFFS